MATRKSNTTKSTTRKSVVTKKIRGTKEVRIIPGAARRTELYALVDKHVWRIKEAMTLEAKLSAMYHVAIIHDGATEMDLSTLKGLIATEIAFATNSIKRINRQIAKVAD